MATRTFVPLMRCSCPVPLAEKHPKSIMFPPPCLTVGMVFLGSYIGSIPPPPNKASWGQRAGFWFHLTTTLSPSSPLNHSDVHWQTSDRPVPCACAFLSRGTLRVLQDFSPSRRSVLPIVFLVTMVPAALRSLTRSVVVLCSSGLIPHCLNDHWNSTRWDLAWSPRPREIDSYSVFLPFANNCTNCCHLLTKLLGDGLVAHPSLV